MSDELARQIENLTHWGLNSFRITVRLVPDQTAAPVEVWMAELWGLETGRELPLEIMAELSLAVSAGEAPPPHILSTRRSYVEWGASAVGEDVVLEVARWALEGVVGSIVYDALRRSIVRLVKAARARHPELRVEPLTAEEAIERGRWTIVHNFGLNGDQLEELVVVGGEELRDGSRVVRYEYGDRRYEVELVERDGLVTIARLAGIVPAEWRTAPVLHRANRLTLDGSCRPGGRGRRLKRRLQAGGAAAPANRRP